MKRAMVSLVVVIGTAIGLAVFAPMAAADPPITTQSALSETSDLTGACSFPITVDSTGTVVLTEFFDNSGVLTRASAHLNEQDTFTANGKSLTGLPYANNVEATFDSSGNITQQYGQGVVEKVLLPDGSFFLSAGRFNFGAGNSPAFTLTPDTGATVNLAGFCAALSP